METDMEDKRIRHNCLLFDLTRIRFNTSVTSNRNSRLGGRTEGRKNKEGKR